VMEMTSYYFIRGHLETMLKENPKRNTDDKFRRKNLPHNNSFVILHVIHTAFPYAA